MNRAEGVLPAVMRYSQVTKKSVDYVGKLVDQSSFIQGVDVLQLQLKIDFTFNCQLVTYNYSTNCLQL